MPATDDFRWNQKTLHAVFAASSVFMLLSVYAMLRQDQNDEWRDVQRTAFEIDSQIRDRELRKVENADFVANRDQIAKQIEETAAEVAKQQAEQATLLADVGSRERRVEALEVDLKFRNSDRDEARANFDLAVRDALPEDLKNVRLEEYRRR